MGEGEMRAGAARVAIDLGNVLPFDGFDELRHEVFARALIIEGTGRRACVLSLEVTSIAPALLADLREVVEDAANCSGAYSWVVPTHTFSMPHVRTSGHLADDATRNCNERYRAALVAAARTAVERAVAGIHSATLATVEGECPVNVNRDIETPAGWWLGSNPRGFADHTMPVLAIRDAGGEYVAVLATADVQSSVLDGSRDSEGRRMASGDLFGFAAMSLERELGGVALLLPGAAGDQGPAERAMNVMFDAAGVKQTVDAHEDGYRMLHQQGQALGNALIEAARMAREDDATGIDARTVDVLLPLRHAPIFTLWLRTERMSFMPLASSARGSICSGWETSSLSAYNPRSRVHSAPLCAPPGPALCSLPRSSTADRSTYRLPTRTKKSPMRL